MEFFIIIALWGIVVALAPIGVWNAKSRLTALEKQIRAMEHRLAAVTAAGMARGNPLAAQAAPTENRTMEAAMSIPAVSPAPPPAVSPPAYVRSAPQEEPAVPSQSFRPAVSGYRPAPAPTHKIEERPALRQSAPESSFTSFAGNRREMDMSPFTGWIAYALTGGRLFVTLGLLLLFIGVAMLLKYVAHTVYIPIELRFTGIALAACGMAAFGNLQMSRRREFGLYLQGGGLGILFLTVFTAFKFYSLLPAGFAFVLLALIGAATFALSMLYDALPLALMAVTGGFLAPLLTSTGSGGPVELFGYYLLINLVIFAIAWNKTWRVLNMAGFGFTFVIGLAWGGDYYGPEYYTSVQTFLIVYFLLYTGMGMLYATRSVPRLLHPIEGASVFGVPLIGFGLQLVLVRAFDNGATFSSLAMGAFYALLFIAFRKSARPGLMLLAVIYKWMALLFITLAVPLHFNAHIAAPLWAMEGTALLCMLSRSQHRLYGYAGMILLGLSDVLMVQACFDTLFFSQVFLPMGLLAMAHFVSSRCLSDSRTFFFPESKLDRLTSVLGMGWWLFAGLGEINDVLPSALHQAMPMLLFFTLSAGAAWFAHRRFAVALLDKPVALMLPAILIASLLQAIDASGSYHPAMDYGVIALPLAFIVHYIRLMQRGENAGDWQHSIAYIAVTILAGLELGYWLNMLSPGDAKRACGVMLTAAGGALLLTAPLKDRLKPLAGMNGRVLAQTLLSLGIWLGLLILYSLTKPVAPLGKVYVPLFNLVEMTELIAVISLLRLAARIELPAEDKSLIKVGCGLLAFAFVNCMALRIASYALEIPYLSDRLFAQPSVQTLFTILWAVTAMGLMIASSQNRLRLGWSSGAALLAVVVVKLFFVDLANTGTLSRIVSFLGVGVLTLALGYIAPMPPKESRQADGV